MKRAPQATTTGPEVVREIVTRLESQYGVAEVRDPQDPLDELIACILSQHTSDVNSLRAFADLKAAFLTWQSVLDSSEQQLADVIRRGGLANSKAARIHQVLYRIIEDFGSADLGSLKEMSDEAARHYLMSLPGVGPKTAAIVLCFAVGRNIMPVDTHIFRVSWRLGLIEKRIGEAKAHDVLQAMVPTELTYRFHVALIVHGRTVCKAPTPRCAQCVVSDLCWWYKHDRG